MSRVRHIGLLLAVLWCMALPCRASSPTPFAPACLNVEADTIIFNGADWSPLYDILTTLAYTATTDTTVVLPIVHLGDSHVQAGFLSAALRRGLQARWGDAGRGLITPLRLCGTNEPTDYSITSPTTWNYYKCMGNKHRGPVGLSGVAIVPGGEDMELHIATLSRTDSCSHYNTLRLFHATAATFPTLLPGDTLQNLTVTHPAAGETRYEWDGDRCQITLKGRRNTTADSCAIYAMSLTNSRSGVVLHEIGNNGASCDTYNRIPHYGKQLAALGARLIIVSMGTNESMGKIVQEEVYNAIDRLVTDLKQSNPDALLLLTTPAENKVRRRKGRKGRRRSYYAVNAGLPIVRNAIMQYGRDHGIAVWDWYTIAGGQGSCEVWYKAGGMARDRIHYTREGYTLQGELLYKSIAHAYDGYME